MGEFGEEVEPTVVLDRKIEESSMNLEKSSVYVGAMDEAVEAASVPDQQY